MERETANPATLVLHDGAAGNRRQALALATALDLPALEFELRPRPPARWISPKKWPFFAPSGGAGQAFGDDFAHVLARPPRLAIGCGRHAALATRLLGECGAKTVQILDPRIDTRHWHVVIAPEHDGLRGANVITLPGSLNPVDDAWLDAGRARFDRFAALPSPRTAVLLGGDSAHWRLDAEKFERFAAALEALAQREGGSLLLTVSRRTPADIVAQLTSRFADVPHALWRDHRDGENPYAGLLAHAQRIVCTPDSVNMISEACATRVPVFVFDARGVRGRARNFVDALLARKRIREFDAALAPFAVEPLRETPRVAAEVKRRLGL